MRGAVVCLLLAALPSGCLRNTEFRCASDAECGAAGTCEPIGYCSLPSADCLGTGRVYADSAGQNLGSTCVPATSPNPGPDAGVDAAIDAAIDAAASGCPPSYVALAGSTHRYRVLADVAWADAVAACKASSADAYLAIPDDAAELMGLATLAAPPFWIGLDDQDTENTFLTQKRVVASFTPWQTGQPDDDPPGEDCVSAISATEITDERCGGKKTAVCECEP